MSVDTASLGYGRSVFRDDHEAFRDSTRKFFQKNIEPNVHRWEAEGHFPAELFVRTPKAGLPPQNRVSPPPAGGD